MTTATLEQEQYGVGDRLEGNDYAREGREMEFAAWVAGEQSGGDEE
jgi:hypothetical protein